MKASKFKLTLTRAYQKSEYSKAKKLSTLKASTIKKRLGEYYYGVKYKLSFPKFRSNKSYFVQIVQTAPGGWSAVGSNTWEFRKNYVYLYSDYLLNNYNFFEGVNKEYGYIPTGTYIITIYFNGMKVASSTFKVQ